MHHLASQRKALQKSSTGQGNDVTLNVGRRCFIRGGTLFISAGLASAAHGMQLSNLDESSLTTDLRLTIGLLTDLHYADKPTAGSRHYRETLPKLEKAATEFRKQQIDFLVELGDLVDAADSVDLELKYLKTINQSLSAIADQRHYVLGNHCVHTLTKNEFLGGVEQVDSYYSFDSKGYHFVVLDACFRSDGVAYGRKNFQWTDPNIPPAQLDWLASDLEQNELPTVVFTHQRLDVNNHYGIKNAPKVRELLESSGKVQAVFQGHSHKNDLKEIEGIPYCTLVAMVEGSGADRNNACACLRIAENGNLSVQGFFKQASYEWPGDE